MQLRGLVLGAFHLGDIVREVLASMPQQAADYLLRDLDAPSGLGLLYQHRQDELKVGADHRLFAA